MSKTTLKALRNGDLAGAREVTLREGLTEFPPELFGLADTLEVLDLSGNALDALPADMGRFTQLRLLFCSDNRFTRLPPSLGDCAALSQIGFRGNQLEAVPAESLPPAVRWLTLTDNRLAALPEALGEKPALQKLLLSGNRLERLPEGLAQAENLELLRLAANRFETLPGWLTRLPSLAWLAWAGNPLDRPVAAATRGASVDWSALRPGVLLGEGASGLVHGADWITPDGGARPVALKLFKGAMTSDGLPEREIAACLAAGEHPHLTGALGRMAGHPRGVEGLLMPLLPAHWRALAGPPSRRSCSRDVYAPDLRLGLDVAMRLARGVGAAAAHLQARGISHGDLYAHNVLWDGDHGQAVLSDFGAASFTPPHQAAGIERLEVLAWGRLLGELLDRVDGPTPVALETLLADCLQPDVRARPSLAQALEVLDGAI